MKITEENVRYIAGLANLSLEEREIPKLAKDLDSIIGYVETLNELDTAGVEPMSQVLFDAGETATLREDLAVRVLTQDDAMANAPVSSGGYFKVPRVIEK